MEQIPAEEMEDVIVGLHANRTLQTLVLLGNDLGSKPGMMGALFDSIQHNEHLVSLNLTQTNIGTCDILPEGWTYTTDRDLTCVTNSRYDECYCYAGENHDLPPAGAKSSSVVALIDGLQNHKALTSVNVLNNKICVEQAHELIQILERKDRLKTLCGLKGEETELDQLRGFYEGEVVLIANEIKTHRALTFINCPRYYGEPWYAPLDLAKLFTAAKHQAIVVACEGYGEYVAYDDDEDDEEDDEEDDDENDNERGPQSIYFRPQFIRFGNVDNAPMRDLLTALRAIRGVRDDVLVAGMPTHLLKRILEWL